MKNNPLVNVLGHVNKSPEQSARKLRYDCFENAIKTGFADIIATAHHIFDNTETVLYRIALFSSLKIGSIFITGLDNASSISVCLSMILLAENDNTILATDKSIITSVSKKILFSCKKSLILFIILIANSNLFNRLQYSLYIKSSYIFVL